MGKTYFIKEAATEKDSGVEENQVVSGVISGDTNTNLWKKQQKVDFYTLKGVMESLFELLGLSNRVKLNPADVKIFFKINYFDEKKVKQEIQNALKYKKWCWENKKVPIQDISQKMLDFLIKEKGLKYE